MQRHPKISMSKKAKAEGGAFRFRVSDSLVVPLRGRMLRLRVVEGSPAMADLKPGSTLRVSGPGADRMVTVVAHAVTSGRATQDRLERVRELDVVIADDAEREDGPVDIGWFASGPVAERTER
jgi:hypothetical protein